MTTEPATLPCGSPATDNFSGWATRLGTNPATAHEPATVWCRTHIRYEILTDEQYAVLANIRRPEPPHCRRCARAGDPSWVETGCPVCGTTETIAPGDAPTDNWCQICKKTMCPSCLTDHSHGLDGKLFDDR